MPTPLRVLIVEDQPADAELMLHELRQAGFDPEWQRVETEEEYLAALHPASDIILSDYSLPQFDGLSALRLLRTRGLDLPFILVSGTVGEDIAVSAMKEGADDYLLKDRLTRLGPAVKSALERNRLRNERKLAEAALWESEEYFRSLIENVSDVITVLDSAGTILYESPSIERVLGYKPEELLGQNAFELVHPEELADTAEVFARSLQSPESTPLVEARFRHKDGSWRVMEMIGKLALDRAKQVIGIINTRDITERKRAETAERENAERLKVALATIDLAVFNQDLDLRYTWMYQPQLGYNTDQVVGKIDAELLPPASARQVTEIKSGVLESGTSTRSEIEVALNDRTYRYDLVVEPLRDASGEVVGITGASLDITEHKQAEEQTQRQLQRLTALHTIDQAIAGSMDVNLVFKVILDQVISQLTVDAAVILLYNPAAQALEYAIGRGFRTEALQHTRLPLGEGYAGRAALARQMVHIPDLQGRKTDFLRSPTFSQEGFVSYFGIPLIAKDEIKGVLEVFHRSAFEAETEWLNFLEMLAGQTAIAIDNAKLFEDLQRTNIELEMRVEERTADLTKANRAKDEFLASMSHELRTPLNAVLNISESLEEGVYGELKPRQIEVLRIVAESGHHLLALINDILDLAKIEVGKFELQAELVEVEAFCKASIRMINETASLKGLQVSISNASNIETIHADGRRLKQMLVNLLSNAVKFTPAGGQVGLEVSKEGDHAIRFSVWDSGIGIPADQLEKLFKPFVQLDSSLSRQYAGTGLGLALVRNLAQLHGGSVGVESELGKGSRFYFILPTQSLNMPSVESAKPSAKLKPKQTSTKHKGKKWRILLAEDNVTNMQVTSDYLNDKGYQVIEAQDGLEAIEHALEQKPDLILMDIQMPHMSGLEAIKRLRATPGFDSVPIIALTALAMPGDRELCLEAGANEYATKPASLKKLVEMMENLFRR